MKTTNNLTSPPREKSSVVIQGIDRSTPDDIVTDGKCEELHNVRYKDNAWRPVHEHKVVAHSNLPISNAATTYNIVYKHPAAPESHYIVERKYYSKYYYYDYDSAIAQWQNAITLIASFDEQQKVSHFGNVLLFNGGDVKYFIYKDGAYKSFVIPKSPSLTISTHKDTTPLYLNPSHFKIDEDLYNDPPSTSNRPIIIHKDVWIKWEEYDRVINILKNYNNGPASGSLISPNITFRWSIADATQGLPLIPTYAEGLELGEGIATKKGMWQGEIALFAAYRLADGSIISPSPIHIHISNNDYTDYTFIQESFNDIDACICADLTLSTNYGNIDKQKDVLERSIATFQLPTIDIAEIRDDIYEDLITNVVIFSTRIHPIFDATYFKEGGGAIRTSAMYSENNLPDSQFYLLAELSTANDDGIIGPYSISLTSETMESIIHNRMYTPTITSPISGTASLDYNNRLHYANVQSSFQSEPLTENPFAVGGSFRSAISLRANNQRYNLISPITGGDSLITPYNLILSYHDSRADKVSFLSGNTTRFIFPLSASLGNNIAYYISSNSTHKYAPLYPTFAEPQNFSSPLEDNRHLSETNRIQVSAPNNCFSFPFENSYAVGSANNRIIALQSAAIKIGDEKVGALPLYVFTTEGIYALRAGEETLYAAVNPVNYDKIINPNTLAINGAIVYITEKGMHLLTNQGTQVISSPIHDSAGMPPLDFLRSCKIIYPKQYNEIVLLNEEDKEGVAYVYNLDAQYWSTRDLEGFKLNTDELYHDNTIYDLADEDESKALPMSITTRPIKLGNIEFKRLETIAPRMSSGDKDFASHIHLTGSVDGTNYIALRREHDLEIEAHKVNPFILRRTPFSAKYFKYHMFMEPKQGDTFNPSITHIDFEWYMKFRHRMR